MFSRLLAGRVVGFAGALLVVAALAGPSMALAAGGNSDTAKLCQKGGWAALVRPDGTTFANQGECVAYGAGGGTLYVEAAINQSGLVYYSTRVDWEGPVWAAFVAGTGFTPGALITFSVTFGNTDPLNGNVLNSPASVADGTGAFDTHDLFLATDVWGVIYLSCSPQTITVTATDGTHLGAYTASIPACPI